MSLYYTNHASNYFKNNVLGRMGGFALIRPSTWMTCRLSILHEVCGPGMEERWPLLPMSGDEMKDKFTLTACSGSNK